MSDVAKSPGWGGGLTRHKVDNSTPKPNYITISHHNGREWVHLHLTRGGNNQFETLRRAVAVGEDKVSAALAEWAIRQWPELAEGVQFRNSGGLDIISASWPAGEGIKVSVNREIWMQNSAHPEAKAVKSRLISLGFALPGIADPVEKIRFLHYEILPKLLAYLARQPALDFHLTSIPRVLDPSLSSVLLYQGVAKAEMEFREAEGMTGQGSGTLAREAMAEWFSELVVACAKYRNMLTQPGVYTREEFQQSSGYSINAHIGQVFAVALREDWAVNLRARLCGTFISNSGKSQIRPEEYTLETAVVTPESLRVIEGAGAEFSRQEWVVLDAGRLQAWEGMRRLAIFSRMIEGSVRLWNGTGDSVQLSQVQAAKLTATREFAEMVGAFSEAAKQSFKYVKQPEKFFRMGFKDRDTVYLNTLQAWDFLRVLERHPLLEGKYEFTVTRPGKCTESARQAGVQQLRIKRTGTEGREASPSEVLADVAEALLELALVPLPELLHNLVYPHHPLEHVRDAVVEEMTHRMQEMGLAGTDWQAYALAHKRPDFVALALRLMVERPLAGKEPLATAEDFTGYYQKPGRARFADAIEARMAQDADNTQSR